MFPDSFSLYSGVLFEGVYLPCLLEALEMGLCIECCHFAASIKLLIDTGAAG